MKYASPSLSGLTAIEKASVKDQTLEQLKNYILSGAVRLGERLPSERALADALGVGRYSVREALKVLEAVGLVESRVGDGTFLTTNTGASFGRILGLSLATWGGTIIELLDARKMIEVEAARAAAERASPEEINLIETELKDNARQYGPRAALFASRFQFSPAHWRGQPQRHHQPIRQQSDRPVGRSLARIALRQLAGAG